jgi:hypothetical protein
LQNSDSNIRSILNFYENNSARIEIFKDGELYEFWFPRLPYCVFRTNEAKEAFKENVNRTNSKTKCENLVRNSKILLVMLKVDYLLRTKLGNFFGLFIKYIELWKTYMQILALTINILILFSYSTELGGRLVNPSIGVLSGSETENLIIGLGVTNLI